MFSGEREKRAGAPRPHVHVSGNGSVAWEKGRGQTSVWGILRERERERREVVEGT